jgi:hypothetical protein
VPATTNNPGQGVVITGAKISGPAGVITPIDDHFTSALDTTTWVIRAAEPNDVTPVPNDVRWSLSWTLPDLYFSLQGASSIAGPWTDLSVGTNAFQRGQNRMVLLSDASLPSKTSAFFRLKKAIATQLQVLLPGETNAPGTATGKTGTPETQYVLTPFNVTVNACDSNWNIVQDCTDTVHFTSTDAMATLPADTALVRGTVTVANQMNFGNSGSWKITASDVTTNAVANGVSSTVTVP